MILTLVHMCETAAAWQETEKPHSWKQPLYVPQPSPLARHDNAAYPSFFFLDPVRERHLFYYQQRKRSPPSSRLVFLWRRVEGWGKNTERRKRRRETSAEICLILRREMRFHMQVSFSEPVQNMHSRCFKDLQLKLLSQLLQYLTQRCFSLLEKLKELVSGFKKGLVMFPSCLC